MLYPKDTIKIEQIKTILTKDGFSITDTLMDLLRVFDITSLCLKNGMIKHKGYSLSDIVTVLLLFPFMTISTVRSFSLSRFNQLTEAKKDTFFRLKNNEYFNWRNLLYFLAKRFKKLVERSSDDEAADSPKCFILDDSTTRKEGTKIEYIGKVFDHVIRQHVLGFKFLLLAFWDGKSLIPLDFSYHSEKGKNKKYPFGLHKRQLKRRFSKQRSKNDAGSKRSREVVTDKITNGIALIKRAVKHGFVPEYVLTDCWFSSEKMIKAVRLLKKGIIHFLGMVRMDKRVYEYQGEKLNAKALKKQLRPKMKRAKKLNAYYIETMVTYNDIGSVKLFFVRFSKRSKWRLVLTTNLELSFHHAIEIYNIRWTIEVLFKECKQLLNLGKCQSNDFDAQIADATLSLMVYTMLSFHKRIHCYTSLGALFAQYRDEFIEATIAEKLWVLFLNIQLTIAETFGIDYTDIMNVLFQQPEVQKTLKSLSEIFFEDHFSIKLGKAA